MSSQQYLRKAMRTLKFSESSHDAPTFHQTTLSISLSCIADCAVATRITNTHAM